MSYLKKRIEKLEKQIPVEDKIVIHCVDWSCGDKEIIGYMYNDKFYPFDGTLGEKLKADYPSHDNRFSVVLWEPVYADVKRT